MDGHIVQVSPASLHEQVTSDLLRRLQDGQFPPGAALPTEAALCRDYGVSRITVRRSLAALVDRGLIVRRRGIGSFVTGRPAKQREFHLVGFLDDKLEFAHQVIGNAVEAADERIAAALDLEPGRPVRHIASVVHRAGEAFTVTDAYTEDLPNRRLSEADYAGSAPTAHRMGRRLGRQVLRAEQELDAVAADALVAERFGIARQTPVMRARRVYFAADDQPIQYLVVRYHPERYRFVVDLVPRAGATAFETAPATTKQQEETS